MITFPPGVRVWLATGHTDMRRGFPSLALMVQEQLKRDPKHFFRAGVGFALAPLGDCTGGLLQNPALIEKSTSWRCGEMVRSAGTGWYYRSCRLAHTPGGTGDGHCA